MAETSPPTMQTLARLLDQTIQEQRDTRERLDVHSEISAKHFTGLEKQLDGLRDTQTAQFLTISHELSDVRKSLARLEEHVGFLTTKVVARDAPFDAVDSRLDQIDARLDAHDTRFDQIDARLDSLTDMVTQIRDAVVPPAP